MVSGEFTFPPASLSYFSIPETMELDGGLAVSWFNRTAKFAFEYKSLSTPKALEEATRQVITRLKKPLLPMVIVPYLSGEALDRLENQMVSGLDLCGNGVVIAQGQFWLRQGREPNRFKSSMPLRNIFRGTSSLVARCFLLRESFETLAELRQFALAQMPESFLAGKDGAILSKGTVSKVVRILEEERIVERDKTRVRLLARERLLEQLQSSHRKGDNRAVLGKSPLTPEEIWAKLAGSQMLYVGTGTASASYYGLISGLDRQQLYVDSLSQASELLMLKPTRLFPTVELIEEKSPVPYFNACNDGPKRWASLIQTWLELSAGDPREQIAAQQLRSNLALQGSR